MSKKNINISLAKKRSLHVSTNATPGTIDTTVLIAKKRSVHVSTNATAGIIDTTVPVTIKTIPVLSLVGPGSNTLEGLMDVNAISETTGDTLVYDSTSKTWVAQPLDISNITGNIDSGTF